MSRRIQAFKQCDVAKAIRAVLKAGLNVERLELDGGKIVVIPAKAAGVLLDECHVVSTNANADRVIGQLRGGVAA
jgi:hypothetical protein